MIIGIYGDIKAREVIGRRDCGNRKREWQPGQCPKLVFHLIKNRGKEKIIDYLFFINIFF